MKKNGVGFTKDEYLALLRRISVNYDDKMNYTEFVYGILPHEPYSYPSFSKPFNTSEIFEYLSKKTQEFGVKVTPKDPLLYNKSQLHQSTPFSYSFVDHFNPFEKGRNRYIYDKVKHSFVY